MGSAKNVSIWGNDYYLSLTSKTNLTAILGTQLSPSSDIHIFLIFFIYFSFFAEINGLHKNRSSCQNNWQGVLGAQVDKSTDTPTGQYSYHDTTRGIVLIGNPATCYGPYANDPLDELKANCKIAWRQELKEYWLRAQGPIAASTELLLMYGHEFWEWQGSPHPDIINKSSPIHLRRP